MDQKTVFYQGIQRKETGHLGITPIIFISHNPLNRLSSIFSVFDLRRFPTSSSVLVLISVLGTDAALFTQQNKCKEAVWPGILAGSGKSLLKDGGFALKPNGSIQIDAQKGWSGRFWPRTGCTFNQFSNEKCINVDCGNKLARGIAGGAPLVSLTEFTLHNSSDFYDVSLVDGYNLPIFVYPSGGTGQCKSVECVSDFNQKCPNVQLKDNNWVVACKSACMEFNTSEYCCTGQFGGHDTCKPTNFSKIFKNSCPMHTAMHMMIK